MAAISPSGAAVPIAVTMGEPAGISGEITLKAWLRRREGFQFVAIDDPARLSALAADLGLDVPIVEIESPHQVDTVFGSALPIIPLSLARSAVPGRLESENEECVIQSIDRAIDLVERHECSAVVTNPIHKAALLEIGFGYPGHTEYLGFKARVANPVMMISSPILRVVPVSVHVPLSIAVQSLSTEQIIAVTQQAHTALQNDFGIPEPRLAIAGLNPHAGEGGTIGVEEVQIIEPAIRELNSRGIKTRGPLPADSMFHAEARSTYDAAICLYHDQALIPLKALSFDDGVNVTLGLPFVRTSPDHGTGLDIAGTGRARESSLVAAIKLAATIAARRYAGASLPG